MPETLRLKSEKAFFMDDAADFAVSTAVPSALVPTVGSFSSMSFIADLILLLEFDAVSCAVPSELVPTVGSARDISLISDFILFDTDDAVL